MDAIVKIETIWVKEDATGEKCASCDEPIYSKANALYIIVNNKTTDLNTRVCDSCFELIKKDAV